MKDIPHNKAPTRRQLVTGVAGMALLIVLRPASAATADLDLAVAKYVAGARITAGKVKLDIAELVDNGNVVPITVTVDSPMTAADHVKSIAIFN